MNRRVRSYAILEGCNVQPARGARALHGVLVFLFALAVSALLSIEDIHQTHRQVTTELAP